MKLKILTTLAFLTVFAYVATITDSDGRQGRDLHITSLYIQFDKTDATFVINYDFGELPTMYLLIFGSKSIEPDIKSIFSNFDYDIVKMDQEKAILKVKNISVLNKGYYLHDSRKFGQTIDVIYITDPSSIKVREYDNMNSTPNYFYRA
jgi:hypothetical protein